MTQEPKKPRGRPATGIARPKVSVSLPPNLTAKAKEIAKAKDQSLSDFVEEAMRQEILRFILKEDGEVKPNQKGGGMNVLSAHPAKSPRQKAV
jgi:metal-responsive CopG/Arc/MetJ family transcriptional regulator